RPPVIMPAIEIAGRQLVDGGLHNTVPVAVARELGAERVIAVNVGEFLLLPPFLLPYCAAFEKACRNGTLTPQSLRGQLAFMANLLARGSPVRPEPDVLIRPNLRGVRSTVPLLMDEAIQRGERAARRALPEIDRLLETPARNQVAEGERAG
ncbi:MAG TPA: hypothetical protein VNL15_03660, partial [Dehalococcoidia bacterium]|nr:hypothetical protein [Dehalococcoidia bacterium]